MAPLSEARRQVLISATARLLPSDDGPGAIESGVAEYVEQAVQHRVNRDFLALLERGLDFVQWLAVEQEGKDFVACPPERQDAILSSVQDYQNNDARRFFERLLQLALEGFLCDPGHGGNRREVGWRYFGFTSERQSRGGCLLTRERA